jgi:tRNA(fMet)-specific endonuclease VapC
VKYLLDTDTCIAAMRGRSNALAKVTALSPDDCVVSTITVYELAVGVAKCREPSKEAAKVARFLGHVHVLPLEVDAARAAGEIRAALEQKGQAIGPYDVLLAGQALARGLQLVSGNVAEFSRVRGLQIEGW